MWILWEGKAGLGLTGLNSFCRLWGKELSPVGLLYLALGNIRADGL